MGKERKETKVPHAVSEKSRGNRFYQASLPSVFLDIVGSGQVRTRGDCPALFSFFSFSLSSF